MLKISEHTYLRYQVDAVASYIERCLSFVEYYFPDITVMADRENLVDAIHAGTESAAMSGYGDEPDVFGFLYFYFLLGSEFPADPRYTWLHYILDDARVAQADRIDRALEEAAQRMDRGYSLEGLITHDQAEAMAENARINA
jgi:hypothetical protein